MLAATSLTSTGRDYHVYLSCAHVDEQGRERVQKIVNQLRAAFEARSGEPLRIFVDRLQLRMDAMWEPQLFHAMRRSCVMLAMLSSAYFKRRSGRFNCRCGNHSNFTGKTTSYAVSRAFSTASSSVPFFTRMRESAEIRP